MLHLEYLQNQWLMLSLLLGSALVLLLAAAYMAFWRPREESPGEGGAAAGPKRRVRMPWFLTVIFVGITLWGVIYTVWMAFYPPNW